MKTSASQISRQSLSRIDAVENGWHGQPGRSRRQLAAELKHSPFGVSFQQDAGGLVARQNGQVARSTQAGTAFFRPRVHGANFAFTMVELLATLAIVAILASLLLAGIARTKRKGCDVQCVNNVRQLGLAMQQFVLDHGAYPLWGTPRGETQYPEHERCWEWALQRQLDQRAPGVSTNDRAGSRLRTVWKCPSSKMPPLPDQRSEFVSYGYNRYGLGFKLIKGDRPGVRFPTAFGLGGHPESGRSWPVKDTEVVVPVETIALGDAFVGWNGVIMDGEGRYLWRKPSAQPSWDPGAKRSNARHGGKATIAFCDGHVAPTSLKFLFSETTDVALRSWNRDNLPHRERLVP